MILFTDTDILLKLGAMDLFDHALEVLGVSREEVRVLPQAVHYVRKRKDRLVEQYGEEGVQRTLKFTETVPCIRQAPDDDELQRLLSAGLDVGEATIFAVTRFESDYAVCTGDKRALRELVADTECSKIAKRHHGKVICLEEILLRVLAQYEFQDVLPRIVSGCDCDISVLAAFGSRMKSERHLVIESLKKRVLYLDGETGGALLSKSP